MTRRKLVKVALTLSVAPHVTATQARREVRSRINHLAGWHMNLDDSDVRARKAVPGHDLTAEARLLAKSRDRWRATSRALALENESQRSAIADLLEHAKLLDRTIVFNQRQRAAQGDDEGVRLNGLTLHLVRESIAAAEAVMVKALGKLEEQANAKA